MNQRQRILIAIFCSTMMPIICAFGPIDFGPIEQRRYPHEAGITYKEKRDFTQAIHTHKLNEFFEELGDKVKLLATSSITIQDKYRNPRSISTFLYALTYGTQTGFRAAERLLDEGADSSIPYKEETPLKIAIAKKAPQSLIEKLKAKEPELQRQPLDRPGPIGELA